MMVILGKLNSHVSTRGPSCVPSSSFSLLLTLAVLSLVLVPLSSFRISSPSHCHRPLPRSSFSPLLPSSSSLRMIRRGGGRPRGPVRTIEVKPMMNEGINFPEMRVVTQNPMGKDEPVGVMTREKGIEMAKEVRMMGG